MFDWNLVVNIIEILLAAFLAVVADRAFERRPKLVAYMGGANFFDVKPEGQPEFRICTHNIIIMNERVDR